MTMPSIPVARRIWLAAVIDSGGCWSCAISGQDGEGRGAPRYQLSGIPSLIEQVHAIAGCGTISLAGRKATWRLTSWSQVAPLLRALKPHMRIRARLVDRLLDWPALAIGAHAMPEVAALRRAIARDLVALDPYAPSRPPKIRGANSNRPRSEQRRTYVRGRFTPLESDKATKQKNSSIQK